MSDLLYVKNLIKHFKFFKNIDDNNNIDKFAGIDLPEYYVVEVDGKEKKVKYNSKDWWALPYSIRREKNEERTRLEKKEKEAREMEEKREAETAKKQRELELERATKTGRKPSSPKFIQSSNRVTWDNWNKKSEPSPSQVDLMIDSVSSGTIDDIVKHFKLKDYRTERTWGPSKIVYDFEGTKSVFAQINNFITSGRIGSYLRYGWPEFFSGQNTVGKMKDLFNEDIERGEQEASEKLEAEAAEREAKRQAYLEQQEEKKKIKLKIEELQARKDGAKRKAEYSQFKNWYDKVLKDSKSRLDKMSSFRGYPISTSEFKTKFLKWFKPIVSKRDQIAKTEQYDPEKFDFQSGINSDLWNYRNLSEELEDRIKILTDEKRSDISEKQLKLKKLSKEKTEEQREKLLSLKFKATAKRIENLLDELEILNNQKKDMTEFQFENRKRLFMDRFNFIKNNIIKSNKDILKDLKDEYSSFFKLK